MYLQLYLKLTFILFLSGEELNKHVQCQCLEHIPLQQWQPVRRHGYLHGNNNSDESF